MSETTCKTCRWVTQNYPADEDGACLNPLNDRIAMNRLGLSSGVRHARLVLVRRDTCPAHQPQPKDAPHE